VPVKKFVAAGGLPHHTPLVVEVYAAVLGAPIAVPRTEHGPALGAAILGALAAGAFATPSAAIRAMAAGQPTRVVQPNRRHRTAYNRLYRSYRALAAQFSPP